MTTYHIVDVDGIEIFYRQSGSADKPVVILLHGFPSASHMFRELIPVKEIGEMMVQFLKKHN